MATIQVQIPEWCLDAVGCAEAFSTLQIVFSESTLRLPVF